MSLGSATRGLYGPSGGSSVSLATVGLYASRWAEVAAVAALVPGVLLWTRGGAAALDTLGGGPAVAARGGAVALDAQGGGPAFKTGGRGS